MHDSTRWEKIKHIFQTALELEPSLREKFLDETCADDADIRREVESLLAAYDDTPDILEKPALEANSIPRFDNGQFDKLIGRQIGPYQIEMEIGRGGMGVIYLANRIDGQFEKQVAIKVAKIHLALDNAFSRFSNERQILASLVHPNIAQLYDSGSTTEGFPYFIMEFIDGLPIDVFCDNHRLTILQRLNLFRQVCAAVHFAHQHLIVHRDLKPSNILVTTDGTPKLLDFGIAKLLDSDATSGTNGLTVTGFQVFTPEFASPEQIQGGTLTTASDIYSLGVILYRLLTGHRLYRTIGSQPYEIARAVMEEEPVKPSLVIQQRATIPDGADEAKIQIGPERISRLRRESLSHISGQLKGDLDNIILKALKKEPNQRYVSVEQLSEDIRRFQVGLPVIARGDSPRYRARKFIRRHKMGVLSAILILLFLVGGIISTAWQARLARTQRDIALKAANSMIYKVAMEMSKSMGPTENRIELLNQAVSIFDEVTEKGYENPDVELQTADAHRILAQAYRALGDINRAENYVRKGKATIERLAQHIPENRQFRYTKVKILLEYGEILNAKGMYPQAKTIYNSALRAGHENLAESGTNSEILDDVAMLLIRIGDRFYYEGEPDSSENKYEAAYTLMHNNLEKKRQDADYLAKYAITIERLGDIFYAKGKIEQSCERYLRALEIRQDANQIDPDNVQILRMLANSLGYVGWCAEQTMEWSKAISLYDAAINIQENLNRVDPANVVYISNLMGLLGTRGEILVKQDQLNLAIDDYENALSLWNTANRKAINTPHLDFKSVQISHLWVNSMVNKLRFSKAITILDQALKRLDALLRHDPIHHDFLDLKAQLLIARGDLFLSMKQPQKSVESYQTATVVYDSLTAHSNFSMDYQKLANAYCKYAAGLIKNQRLTEAQKTLSQAKNILLKLREQGKLSDTSEGFRVYLPKIERMLAGLP